MNDFALAFRGHKSLLLISLIYMAVVTAVIFLYGGSAGQFFAILGFYLTACLFTLFFILAVLCVFLAQALYETDDFSGFPLGWLKRVVGDFERRLNAYVHSGMLSRAFWGLVALVPLLTFFSMGKSMIPHIVPYRWDPLLSAADRVLHGGRYPHEWLQPIVDRFHMLPLLDNAYLVWFGVLFFVNGFAIFCDRDETRRMQYLWSFSICWILSGTVLATVFSSCGPVFYHLFYPALPDPYNGLVKWLMTAHDGQPAHTFQEAKMLYGMEQSKVLPQLNGISAMPSQHVAVSWLMALYARRIDKTTGAIGFAYAILILLASIVLGWHYAVDGYAGLLLVSLIWWAAGRVSRPYDRDYGDDVIVPSVPVVEAP
jgi:membrane-associated phospholipid phosphatase